MYVKFFNLREEPFRLTPNPRFLHLAEPHRDVLMSMIKGVVRRKGFVVATGAIGTGKTTLIHAAMHVLTAKILPGDKLMSAIIVNPTLSRDEFLEALLDEFEIPCSATSKPKRLAALQQAFLRAQGKGGTALIVVDEAHLLNRELLEEIRLLGNVDTYKEKIVQVILTGQPELDEMLESPELSALRQRVAVRCSLRPLSASETRAYVAERLHRAGANGAAIFAPNSFEAIYHYSQGVPRVINQLCDSAMASAFHAQSHQVTVDFIRQAVVDLAIPSPANTQSVPAKTEPSGMKAAASGSILGL